MYACFVDLEMNQPSGKLIQIGAVSLDLKTGRVDSIFHRYIDPVERISREIETLTGITDKTIRQEGISLQEALTDFWKWVEENNLTKMVCSWGNDVDALIGESAWSNTSVPENVRQFDVKQMFSMLRCAFPSKKSRGGLIGTMAVFGLEWASEVVTKTGRHEGQQHDAVMDAYNTGRLVIEANRRIAAVNQIKKIVTHEK